MKPPPIQALYPVKTFLKPDAKKQSDIALANYSKSTESPCSIPLEVGLFFDGTNNNMDRDLKGKRIHLPETVEERRKREKEQKSEPARPPLANRTMKPEDCSHSNVVRLHNTFPGNKQDKGFFRYYIPGVGTEFKEIGEPTESMEGKAFAKGGQPRIIWGFFQALNAIHMVAYDQEPLYKTDKIGELAKAYGKEVGQPEEQMPTDFPVNIVTHQSWFKPHLDKLKEALSVKPKPHIPSLTLSIFGFSRGAAEAAAFCHFFNDLLVGGELIGISARIRFVGLFDTVASVGGSASMALTLPLPGAIFDGHWAWAKRILDPLPGCVAASRHFIAAHELRMNFPLTHQYGNIQEILFPGVHSDLGGGYAPGTQGKGRGKQAALLSQIPLVHMYKAAREAGVPLKAFSELELTVQDDLEIDADLASAWEAYHVALIPPVNEQEKIENPPPSGDILLKKHMELYYRWRAARLTTLESTKSFQAAGAQEQEDLRAANRMLAGDLEALKVRRTNDGWRSSDPHTLPFKAEDSRNINHWQFYRAQNSFPLDDWERGALKIFDKREPLPPEVMRFFDDYVHDSFAGFYMAGEVTEYDKRARVAKVMGKKPEHHDRFEARVYEITKRTREAQAKQKAGDMLTPEEAELVRQAEYDTPYPVMTDEEAKHMRKGAVTTQTYTRREGGGYIIQRSQYPQKGFFLRLRESFISHASEAPQEKHQAAEAEIVWANGAGTQAAERPMALC